MGIFDGDVENDLVTRDGKNVGRTPAFDELYRSFGDSWRVPSGQPLFDYAPGESQQTFTDKTFPDREMRTADLPNRDGARKVCQSAGVIDPRFLEDCILDVMLTGDLDFATAAALGQYSIVNYKFRLVTLNGPDSVGRGDGRLEPDGVDDAVFQVMLQGDVADLIMTVCRPDGTPGSSHWDTFMGSRHIPPGYSFSFGSQTWALGVYAEGRQLSNSDGSIALSMTTPSLLTIHVQNEGSLVTDSRVCLDVLTSDGSTQRLLTKLP